MPTETAKRAATMGVLERLRAEGMPNSAKRKNALTGEEMPAEDADLQQDFEKQQAARVTQELANKADTPMIGGSGPTGMSDPGTANSGMVPYSPEEFDKRSALAASSPVQGDTGITALDMPAAKAAAERIRKRKRAAGEAEDGSADFVPAQESVQASGSN